MPGLLRRTHVHALPPGAFPATKPAGETRRSPQPTCVSPLPDYLDDVRGKARAREWHSGGHLRGVPRFFRATPKRAEQSRKPPARAMPVTFAVRSAWASLQDAPVDAGLPLRVLPA